MYIEMYTFKQGDFKFTVELDTGADIGENQLALWYSEKRDINSILLKEIETALLFKALKEPYRSQFSATLNAMKSRQTEEIERNIHELQRPYLGTATQPAHKIPNNIKRQIAQLRRRIQDTIKQIEGKALRSELLNLERDSFNMNLIAHECTLYSEARFLRNFFFEDANKQYMQAFCQKFAHEPDYRQRVLNRETRWYKRDALFSRNLTSILGEQTLLASDGSAMRTARELFRWLDMHTEEILALPAYQQLLALDGNDPQHSCRNDEQIQPAITLFEQLPGVSIQHGCQGVSGKIAWPEEAQTNQPGYTLLAVTQHTEYAHIVFKALSQFAHDTILAHLPAYPAITIKRIPCNFATQCTLRSTGDNRHFQTELLALAQDVKASWHASEQASKEKSDEEVTLIGKPQKEVETINAWTASCYPEACPVTAEPGGMLAGRRQWHCQPQQIERTLQLLYHLNHWAKASDQLFYVDRQGLYSIKAALLQECYEQGHIVPDGYSDGSQIFTHNIMCEIAADAASDTVFFRLSEVEKESSSKEEAIALALYRRVIGKDYHEQAESRSETEGEKRAIEQVRDYIQNALVQMVEQAQRTRQPLSTDALRELYVYPTDLLDIHYARSRYISDWSDLSNDDLRLLDPEGWSVISFQYNGEQAQYTFHLPYRKAENFIAEERLVHLREQVSATREEGMLLGRAISAEESQRFPLETILHELQSNIQHLCPKQLERKQEHFSNSWYTDTNEGEDEDYDDDSTFWTTNKTETRTSKHKKKSASDPASNTEQSSVQQRSSKEDPLAAACPQCQQDITQSRQERVEHWQQMHAEQDLTYKEVLWLLGIKSYDFKRLYITPDYRQDNQPDGKRYWKIATLARVIELLSDQDIQ
jgi:hypothetical protein